jgi:putative transposase
MKKSRFTEEQITYALRLADGGTPVVDVCRQIGISEVTFYTWKKKDADLGVSELRKFKQLEDENARLRRIVAAPARARRVTPVSPASGPACPRA